MAQSVVHEVGELRERLDAGVARADEHEREVPLLHGRVGREVGKLELLQHVVSEVDGVGDVFEAEGVLAEARHRERAADRAERDDEPLVLHLDRPERRLDGHRPCGLVECYRTAVDELGARTHHPQRHDDVPRLERPGGGFRKDRRVEHEVLRADDRGPAFAEQARDVGAGKAAAEDEGATLRLSSHRRILTRPWPTRSQSSTSGSSAVAAWCCRTSR